MSKPVISICLDQRQKGRKKSTFPVVLVIRVNSNPLRFPTVHSLTESDFDKLPAPRLSESLQKIKDDLKSIRSTAEVYVKENKPFNISSFTVNYVNRNSLLKPRKVSVELKNELPADFDFTPYYNRFKILAENHTDPNKISFVFCECIKRLILEERIGTALNYKDSYLSLKKFGGDVLFETISKSWLTRYELWMRKKNRTSATIGIKLRPLRTVFNEAIEMKIVNKDSYPFGKRRYIIPTGRKTKRHLLPEDLEKLITFKPEDNELLRALMYWLFLYYGNGMNPQDLTYLKYSNLIDEEFLSFIRRKTSRTSKEDPHPITVFLTEIMWKIIKTIGNPRKETDSYIFSIMQDNLNPLEQYNLVVKFNKWLNDKMKTIGEILDIPIPPTSMVARHSLATRLKQVGASTEYIQETLGHSSKQTTEIYLGSFTSDQKKEFAKKIAFNTSI